jgi:NADH-quinone oxidoreductase subunit K
MWRMPGSDPALNNYLIVGALLFSLGLVGFLTRRNLIVMFLCAEMMLQGVSVTLVGFSAYHQTWAGQVFTIFSLALAAAEAAIALALFVVLFRRGDSLDVSLWQDLREPNQPPIIDDPLPEEHLVEQSWPKLTPAGRLPVGRRPNPRTGSPLQGEPAQPVVGEPSEVQHG